MSNFPPAVCIIAEYGVCLDVSSLEVPLLCAIQIHIKYYITYYTLRWMIIRNVSMLCCVVFVVVGGLAPWYVTKPTRSTQPCIPLGSLNRVPALIGWGKGGNVTSAGWQVTLCDPIWHVSSRSGEACCELLYSVTLLTYITSVCTI